MRTRSMKAVLAAIFLGLGMSSQGRAEPLDIKNVAADAKWVAHVDFDAGRASKMDQHIREKVLSHKRAQEMIGKIHEEIGLDLRQDLHAITLYGSTFKPHHGVAILRAKADREKLLAHLRTKPDYSSSKAGEHELHSWTEHKGKKHEHTVNVVFKSGVGVFGGTAEEVTAALAVLDGKSPSLGSDSPLAKAADPGTIAFARAIGLADAELPTRSPVLKKSKEICLAMGETEGNVFVKGSLDTGSAEDAAKVKAVVEGFAAMGQLRYAGDEESLKVVSALKVTTADNVVKAEWQAPADAVIAMAQRERAKHKQRGAGHGGGEKQEGAKDKAESSPPKPTSREGQ